MCCSDLPNMKGDSLVFYMLWEACAQPYLQLLTLNINRLAPDTVFYRRNISHLHIPFTARVQSVFEVCANLFPVCQGLFFTYIPPPPSLPPSFLLSLPPSFSPSLLPSLPPQARQRMMLRLGELEEQYDGLQRSKSQRELELANTQATLSDRKAFCHQLQGDCENMSERVTSWAQEQR